MGSSPRFWLVQAPDHGLPRRLRNDGLLRGDEGERHPRVQSQIVIVHDQQLAGEQNGAMVVSGLRSILPWPTEEYKSQFKLRDEGGMAWIM